MSIGVPIKVLQEGGKLIEAEDNMNCQITKVTVTYTDGEVVQLKNIFIRGSIRFLILPDMLKNAPIFQKQTAARGKYAILRAQAARGRGCGVNSAVGGPGTGKAGPPQPREVPGGSGR